MESIRYIREVFMAVLDRIKEITNKDFKFYEIDTTDEEKL